MGMHSSMPDARLDTALWAVWSRLRRGPSLAFGGLTALAPLAALANPSGGHVAAGNATISKPNANTTVVDQGSQHAVINWQQFSVGAGQYVQFIQPDSSAVILNRVIGDNPSSIFGDITANGQVFLINPNGILFGKGSVLDVSGLVAGTQDISNADFMAGHYQFTKAIGAPGATVVNDGSITTSAGGYVVLTGDAVQNAGVIDAVGGRVLLAAGGATTLTLDQDGGLISYAIDKRTLARVAGVDNSGRILADGGMVIMSADVADALTATAVNNSGFVAAHSIKSQGGVIELLAQGGDIVNSGTLDASATQAGAGGGAVLLRTDRTTELAATSKIVADGDGAAGGFIDLSGHGLAVRGLVRAGKGGDLLFDPSKITLVSSCAVSCSFGTDWHIPISATNPNGVEYHLNHGSNVTLQASNSIGHSANVTAISAAGAGILSLHATNPGVARIALSGVSIHIGGGLVASANQGMVTLGAVTAQGDVVITGGNVALGSVSAGGKLSVTAHMPGAAAASISVTPGKLIKAKSVRLFASASDGGNIVTSAIDAKSGSISIDARANASHAAKVQTGSLSAATRVTVQQSGGGNGGLISVGNITAGGSVSVRASDAAGSGDNVAVGAITGRTIQITAHAKKGGDINVAGGLTATASKGQVHISASDASAAANGGNVNVTGNINAVLGHVSIVTHGGGSLGGTLHVGNIGARGAVSISANYLGAGSGFVAHAGNITATNGYVAITMTGHKPQFSAGAITAHGPSFAKASFFESGVLPDGYVEVGLNKTGSAAGASGGFIKVNSNVLSSHSDVSFFVKNGNITLSGPVTAANKVTLTANSVSDAGALSITAHDAGVPTASIAVNAASLKAASVKLLASGAHAGKIVTGNITADGTVTGLPNHSIGGSIVVKTAQLLPTVTSRRGVVTTGDLSATGRITVFGTNISVGGVNAGGEMFLSADGTSARHATVTASKAIVFGAYGSIEANGPSGAISVGNVTTTNGSVSFFASGAAGHPGKITVGNVTAKNYVAFFANSRSGAVNVGTIKASNSYVSVSAAKLTTTGPVTAASYVSFYGAKFTVGGAVTAGAYVEMRGTEINVAGAVTAGSQFGVTLPGHSRPVNAGYVKLFANSAAGKASVNIAGSVQGRTASISAHGGSGGGVSVGVITATAGNIVVSQGGPSGRINTGKLTALSGGIHIVTNDTGSGGDVSIGSAAAKTILVQTTAPRAADIRVNGTLKATGAFSTGTNKSFGIILTANATGGSTSPGGNVRVEGSGSKAVYAVTGGVRLHGHGGEDSGGIIFVHGGIVAAGLVDVLGSNIGSCCGSVSLKNVTGAGAQLRARGIGNRLSVGTVDATAGSIFISGEQITTGALTASSKVKVFAGGHSAAIKVNGAISGSTVQLRATGANLAGGGDVTVTGDIKAVKNVSVDASNSYFGVSGGNISLRKVTVSSFSTETKQFAEIELQTRGGGNHGGDISTGTLTAAEGVEIRGQYISGQSNAFKVQTGAINAEFINVELQGHDPVFTAPALTATGHSTNPNLTGVCSGECGTAHLGRIAIDLNNHSGSINITGPVTTSHGGVWMSGGSKGTVKTGDIKAGFNVALFGHDISIGKVSAGSKVSLTGLSDSSSAIQITANDLVKGAEVNVKANVSSHCTVEHICGPAPFGASINLKGGASAIGLGTSEGGGLKGLSIEALGSGVSLNITSGPLYAAAGNVLVRQGGKSAGGNITIHGLTSAAGAGGNVEVFLKGSGGISIGTVHAKNNATISGFNSHGNNNGIVVNGDVSANRVLIFADAYSSVNGSHTAKGGNVTVNGNITARTGIASISASASRSGGSIKVTGTISAPHGSVDLFADGAGGKGGDMSLGNISAAKGVSLFASYHGSGGTGPSHTIVKTGTLTGEYVNVQVTGKAPVISAAGITANGVTSSAGALHDYIHLTLSATASGSSGKIAVSGPMLSSHGSVKLVAGSGAINVAAVTAETAITMTGGNITTGKLKTTTGDLSLTQTGGSGGIDVTGSISAGGEGAFITAHGSLGITTGKIVSASNVTLKASGSHAGGIQVNGTITAAKFITLTDSGHTAGIVVTGLITATAGGVQVHAAGSGGISVAGIKTQYEVSLDASGSHAGSVIATGNISADGEGVFIRAKGKGGNNVDVTGNIVVGNSESGANLSISASAGTHAGGNIIVGGKMTTTTGAIRLVTHGAGSSGGRLSVGDISAAKALSISANYTGNIAGFLAKTGAIKAQHVGVNMNGFGGRFSAAGITATGPNGSGSVNVDVSGPASGGQYIAVTGPVKSSHGKVSLSVTGGDIMLTGNSISAAGSVDLTATGDGEITVGNVTAGKGLSINASHSGATGSFLVKTGKLTGGYVFVDLNGHAPVFSASGAITGKGLSCECSNVTITETARGTGTSAQINIQGKVSTTGGGIRLNASNGLLDLHGHSISAAGTSDGVHLFGGQLKLGDVTATGGLQIDLTAAGSKSASLSAASTTTLTGGLVNIDIKAPGTKGAHLNLGDVHAVGGTGSGSAGEIVIGAASNIAGKDVAVKAGKLTAATSIQVLLNQAAGGALTFGKLSGTHITVKGPAGVTVGDIVGAHNGGVDLSAGGSLSIIAPGAGSNLTLDGDTLKAGKGLHLKVDGNITLTDVTVTDSLFSASATGTFKDSTTGSLQLAGGIIKASKSLTLVAATGVEIGGAKLSGSAVDITARSITDSNSAGTITAHGGTLSASQTINLNKEKLHLTGTGIKITASSVTLVSAAVTGSGNLKVQTQSELGATNMAFSGGALTLGGSSVRVAGAHINASKAVSIKGGSVHMTGLQATGSGILISASNAGINNGGSGTLTGGAGGITVKAKQNINMAGENLSVTGGGEKFSAGGSLIITGDSFSAAKAVVLKAGAGNVSLSGIHLKGSAVTVSAGNGSVSNGGPGASITAGNGGVKILAAGAIKFAGETIAVTGGGAKLSAGGSLDLASASVQATKGIVAKAHTDVKVASAFFTGSGVSLSAVTGKVSNAGVANSIAGGAGGVTISAKTGIVLTSEVIKVTGGGAAKLSAGAGSIDLTSASVHATKGVTLKAHSLVNLDVAQLTGSAIAISAGKIDNMSGGNPLTAGAGGISLKSRGAILLEDETLTVTGGGAALLSAGGTLDVVSANLNAAGAVTLVGGKLEENLAKIQTGGALSETGGSVDLTSATLIAKHTLTVKSGHDVALANAVLSGSGVAISAAGKLDNSGSAASITAGPGGLKLLAKGAISLNGETLEFGGGAGQVSAGSVLDLTNATLHGTGKLSMAAGNMTLTSASITLGDLTATARANMDLSSVTAHVGGVLQLKAGQDIVLSGVDIRTGVFLASAGGTIHNGGGPGAITAKAMSVIAQKDITLSSTDITIGSGAIPGLAGDALLLQELGALGIAPTDSTLNGAFLARGNLTLGDLNVSGHYLMLQGATVSILGPVSVPTSGFLVQVIPGDQTASIGVEDRPAATQPFDISNQGFFALFPGDTIAIGDDTESGAVFIGANGRMTLAPKTNLFFDTIGPITGLNLITTTGIIGTLEAVAGSGNGVVVTTGEIDPSAGDTKTGLGDQTDKRRLGSLGGNGNGGDGGTIGEGAGGGNVCR